MLNETRITKQTTVNSSRRPKGFTIVEVIVSIIVFSVALMIASSVSGIANKTVDDASNTSIASEIAQNHIELMRNTPYDDINVGTTSITSSLPSQLPHPRSGSIVTSEERTDLKKVEVTISYGSSTQTYATLVRNNETE